VFGTKVLAKESWTKQETGKRGPKCQDACNDRRKVRCSLRPGVCDDRKGGEWSPRRPGTGREARGAHDDQASVMTGREARGAHDDLAPVMTGGEATTTTWRL
jgi:hypothetical protein